MGRRENRRPIWERNSRFRRARLVRKYAAEYVTLKRVIFTIIGVPLVIYLYSQVFAANIVIIEPFTVPKPYEELGLTSEAVSRMIGDAFSDIEGKARLPMNSEIESKTHLNVDTDRLALSFDPSSVPNIEFPGTSLGLQTIVNATRQIFRREPKRVRGGIVFTSNDGAGIDLKHSEAEVILRIVDGSAPMSPIKINGPAADPASIVERAAWGGPLM